MQEGGPKTKNGVEKLWQVLQNSAKIPTVFSIT